MKRAWLRRHGKGALELIEEAFHLVRRAPAGTLASYYVGALPFALGLLYFWADMSRSAFARPRLAGEALGVAVLFLWMKFWQAVFARRLRAHRSAETASRWSARRCWRVFGVQTSLQAPGLFLSPAVAVLVFPLSGWLACFAAVATAVLFTTFFESVTAVGGGEEAALKSTWKLAWRQSALWPRQNAIVLLTLAGFSVCVFLNWASAAYLVPSLLKTFLGIESAVTQSPLSLLNSTSLAALLVLTWLTVDPLLKAVYALRCFYGESLETGEDLRAELRSFRPTAAGVASTVALLFAGLLLFTPGRAIAASGAGSDNSALPAAQAAPGQPSVSPADLDRAANDVLQQRKYAWRLPREKAAAGEAEPGVIARFFGRVRDWIKDCARTVLDWIEALLDRLFRRERTGGGGTSWITPLQGLLFLVIAVVACALGLLVYRVVVHRRRKTGAVTGEAIASTPDIADENVGADQLPEDGWMTLGRELFDRGELRLALRAFYLSSLANLAGRELLTLARFKSNLDYERELRRRAHSFPEMLARFAENVSVFDRSWYGRHELTPDLVGRFVANVENMRGPG